MTTRIRVLVVDDSGLARSLLRAVLEADGGFDVVGEARHGREAVALVHDLRPDLVTMDLDMPVMGGLDAIEEIMTSRAVPILVVSNVADAQNAYAAVSRGAVDVVAKPALGTREQQEFLAKARLVSGVRVITHVRALRLPAASRPGPPPARSGGAPAALAVPSPGRRGGAFAIASSTGGPQALARLLGDLPRDFPEPVLIAQHIADGFAPGMAEWLATLSTLPVRMGQEGEALTPGTVYIAPSEVHLTVTRGRRLAWQERTPKDLYRPSCDRLLESAAVAFGRACVGIILTGMGSDGAKGLAAIRAAGGETIAQDEASSVIFGMNRVAIEQGAVGHVLPLEGIAGAMVRLAGGCPCP
ncbi:chemotaxis-specific protein-glutamate methyltransferase CheB [Pararhodospirillum oryzae]|uniref:Protein-glutamate methylesterase/protein-glutamine glutaminase n=1 Tax=Pararhodospirillum oryzae TaxID=478448 RepID=A0A512HBP9_9PROT|nr:chemotaxis-specific protein-glutamate methyltransferase CheB [Pararhodospirillum oryzae]GEO82871.1 chemotaxis response regulator protein-glutamate methylesterase [Pararhodospirillum oryzae]